MNSTALPGGAQDLRDGRLQTFVGVGDDQLNAFQTAANQTTQELGPEGGGLRLTQAEPEDLAATVLVDDGGDSGRDRHDAPLLADLDVGGVQPEIAPVAVQRPFEERQLTGVNLLA